MWQVKDFLKSFWRKNDVKLTWGRAENGVNWYQMEVVEDGDGRHGILYKNTAQNWTKKATQTVEIVTVTKKMINTLKWVKMICKMEIRR